MATVKEMESRMTRKGKIKIPAEIRAGLGSEQEDIVRSVPEADGVKVQPAESRLLRGYGAVAPTHHPENWMEVRREFEQMVADAAP
jgi:bifunctional DNA-binding transcriptional regulator/antitoxin component of YhaV-PrlF toxin-antitoxin module